MSNAVKIQELRARYAAIKAEVLRIGPSPNKEQRLRFDELAAREQEIVAELRRLDGEPI